MIRRMVRGDKAAFFEMSREFYSSEAVLKPVPDEYHEKIFEELMRSSDYADCFIFVEGEKYAGYALLAKTFSREAGGSVVWLEEIYLREQYRGKGLGKEFFGFLEREFPAARYRLEVEADNAGAIALYKKTGYKKLDYMQMVKDARGSK